MAFLKHQGSQRCPGDPPDASAYLDGFEPPLADPIRHSAGLRIEQAAHLLHRVESAGAHVVEVE